MKQITAFARLVRWPNLVFIVITQCLFWYAVVKTKMPDQFSVFFSDKYFFLLVIASVLIAAAGYIINDYFDINIDAVNKPDKLVVDKIIGRRWAIILHILLSLAGIVLSFYIDVHLHSYWLGLSNTICVFLLFGYSISLKKKLLIGNVLISALTAWVIIVVYLSVQFVFNHQLKSNTIDTSELNSLIRISLLYAGFAFVISLIREVIKDMEDRDGDARYGCKTIPIVWGIPVSKVFTAVWLIVLMAAICIVQLYVLPFGWWWSALYGIGLILLPLAWIFKKLYNAQGPSDYHVISVAVKWVMLSGILSMFFFKLYA